MPKLKTKSAATKRFKLTASGKVKASKAFKRHILTSKTTKSKRQMRGGFYLQGADAKRVSHMLKGC